ncbi:hypothetical protein Pen02_10610 [Plantactinospora endophytica]|uniref:Uncharacterized protein n=1 Tax=Plantactinospora endophytica TaxID=673535 RepID=A0ABQ4DUK8_9ACTN|nr:hypothetical protein Pen02_10610 [Plantactinospora endophytica]
MASERTGGTARGPPGFLSPADAAPASNPVEVAAGGLVSTYAENSPPGLATALAVLPVRAPVGLSRHAPAAGAGVAAAALAEAVGARTGPTDEPGPPARLELSLGCER